MKVRKLNEIGIKYMGDFLDSLVTESPAKYPPSMLIDPATSDSIGVEIEIENHSFSTKFDAAYYLDKLFSDACLQDITRDKGLWSWLSLFFFESLCPKDESGKYKPGARARWIPEVENFQRYYRHLLAGPYRIYKAHRDDPKRAMALLCGPICKQGDIVEQLASRQELITNKSLIGAATVLYYDPASGRTRRGAGGKGPGSPRRLADIIDQFNLTWDLYSMTLEEFLEILPSEFDKFKQTS